jgi:hypothetical protein
MKYSDQLIAEQKAADEAFLVEVKAFLKRAEMKNYRPTRLFAMYMEVIRENSTFRSEVNEETAMALIAGETEEFARSYRETAEANAVHARPENQLQDYKKARAVDRAKVQALIDADDAN